MKKSKQSFQWNAVTPLSKYLAMVLFIALPFCGFRFGMKYQENLGVQLKTNAPVSQSNVTFNDFSDWTTLENANMGISFLHPKNWAVENNPRIIKVCPPGYTVCFDIKPTTLSYGVWKKQTIKDNRNGSFSEGSILVGPDKDIQAISLWTDNEGYYFLNGYIANIIISHSYNDSADINSVGGVLATIKLMR